MDALPDPTDPAGAAEPAGLHQTEPLSAAESAGLHQTEPPLMAEPVDPPLPGGVGLVPRGDGAAASWGALRRFTQARIALGHAGTSLPTGPHLDFQLAHARARDAVHRRLDLDTLRAGCAERGWPLVTLRSAAADRHTYLQRPDLGRRLDTASRSVVAGLAEQWEQIAGETIATPDIVFVLCDGLSARAVQDHALPLLDATLAGLTAAGLKVAPSLVSVEQGRVAVGDEVGEVLGARLVAVLIGERPGLSSPDSMGIYLSYAPRVGMRDAERNCISNIRSEGLAYNAAARKLHYLVVEALRHRLTGVALKEDAGTGDAAALADVDQEGRLKA